MFCGIAEIGDFFFRECTHTLDRVAQVKMTGFQTLARRDQRTRADQHVFFDHRTVEYDTTDTDQYLVFDPTAVQGDMMADGDVIADDQRCALRIGFAFMGDVQHREVLNIAAFSDNDMVHVAADDRARPHRCALAEGYVADHHGGRIDIGGFVDAWCHAVVGSDIAIHDCVLILGGMADCPQPLQMDTHRMSENPLLDFTGLPRFDQIRAEHVTPAIDQLLSDARAVVEQLARDVSAPSWTNFVDPLSDATERLSRAWGVVGHLNAVLNTPEIRDVFNANIPKLSMFWSELGQNLALYGRFKALKDQPESAAYSAARKKIIDNNLRDFKLSGAELPDDQKPRFIEIQARQAELSAQFEQHVLDATDAFSLFIDSADELAGVPADVCSMLAATARQDGREGFKLTLQYPCYLPVMQYAENRELRQSLYDVYVKRASEFGPAELDNGPVIREKLRLNHEEALMLGFPHFAALSLSTKMAESADQVIGFLRDLASRARPFALRDRAELEVFARETLGLDSLEAWDLGFTAEKLRVARYAFSDQEVKQYFTEPKVLAGLFDVVNTLFGVEVRAANAPVWHADVRYFEILHQGQPVGSFYFDLYAREGKRSGAWMDDARGRKVRDGVVQTPVAYLTCNFSAPVDGKPALLTHDDVTTLFHEFGHGLHHMLTRVDELGVSGIAGVEWDAVELPSQFMENFCWEWDVLTSMSAHVDSGLPLPRALFDKMVAAKNFHSGMQMARQLEFSLFDMLLHSDFDVEHGDWLQLLDEVRREVAVNFPPAYNRFPNSFSHIFAGGYAAGYYSYKWAEVLSSDAYGAFEEAGGANPVTGAHFWNEVLAVGGSRPALDSFRAFRGRDPQIDALLRHSGMIESSDIGN